MTLYDVIKEAVEIVQKVHNLNRCAPRADAGKAHDVREEHRARVEHLWCYWFPHL